MQKRINLVGIQEFNRVVPAQYQILISKTVAVGVYVWFLVRHFKSLLIYWVHGF